MVGRPADAKLVHMGSEEVQGETIRGASRRTGVPYATLRRWAARGVVRIVQARTAGPGSPVFVDAASVDAVVQLYRPGRRGGARPYSAKG